MKKITEAMIRGIYSSVSDYAIVTMQDLLDKDATSRMNVPSTVGGNWEWRMLAEDLTEERKEFFKKHYSKIFKREGIKCHLVNMY